MNEVDRKMIEQALNKISGRGGNPPLRWHVERPDGRFDSSDGRVRSEKDLAGKKGVLVFVEEVQTRLKVELPPPQQGKGGFRIHRLSGG
jgi:hypothetical protein